MGFKDESREADKRSSLTITMLAIKIYFKKFSVLDNFFFFVFKKVIQNAKVSKENENYTEIKLI